MTVVNTTVDECAAALAAFFNNKNAKTHREAQIKFSLVDWVETEVDPDTPEGRYVECVYQAGIQAGFKTYEDLTDAEEKILYPADFFK